MKNKLLVSFLSIVGFFTLTSELMDDDGRAGATGSPGETTCNTSMCHNSYSLNSGGGSISSESNMINWKYEPLTTYTISIKVAKQGVGLFGFGTEILTATNTNAGLIIVTDAVRTQIKNRTINGVARRNIVHRLNGGASQDSMIFTFNWTSPDTSTGPVTMYFAGNATDSSGNTSGDYIYTSSQIISPSTGTDVMEIVAVDLFNFYPNPANNYVCLHYNLSKNETVQVGLYDLKGRLLYVLMKNDRFAGTHNECLTLPPECMSGLYLLSIKCSSGSITRKIMIY